MQMGGAEKVVEVFHDLFPDAPVYTSAYDPDAMPAAYRSWDIRTSFLQKLPAKRLTHRAALLLYPTAFESFDLSSYDLVLSSSSAFSKGVITQPHTTHICYTHSPMRYAWATSSYVEKERISSPLRSLLLPGLHYLRTWDAIASMRVDRYIANSSAVARRIRKFYRREAEVVHPPVDTDRFQIAPRDEVGDYGIVASRLVPYKRVDLAVRAFTKLKLPLKVVGTGRQLESLKAVAGPTIEFLGYVPDSQLPGLVARAKMYLMPGEEDFGIAPVEANAAGVPVVAFAAGGALDVQVEGKSGLLFRRQSVDELCDAVERAYAFDWDPDVIRENAMRFDMPSFRAKIEHVIATTHPGNRRDENVERRRSSQGRPRGSAQDRRRTVMKDGRVIWYDRRLHILSPDGKTVVGERSVELSVPTDIVPVEAPTRMVVPDSLMAPIQSNNPASDENPPETEALASQLRNDGAVQIHDATPSSETVSSTPALHSVTRNGHYLNGHIRLPSSATNGDHSDNNGTTN